MNALRQRFVFLFGSIKGLALVAIALISLVTALWGMLSGPLKEWGISEAAVRLHGMRLVEAEREGRIIMLYKAGDWRHIPLTDASLRLAFDGQTFRAKPGYENRPMTLVTWFGAQAYCAFYGWRLPSELEWEKAARGTDNRPFPWGHEIRPENANFYASGDPFERLAGKQGDATPVSFYNGRTYDGYRTADSPSPYGLYDMAGNVWQWAADLQEGIHDRWLRGGSKDNYGYNSGSTTARRSTMSART